MEDGYEVMGPGGNANKPLIPPPPCPAVKTKKDVNKEKDKTQESSAMTVSTKKDKKGKKGNKNKKNNQESAETGGGGTAINQRPSSVDTVLLACVCVVFIITICGVDSDFIDGFWIG
ncbi:unnamed protein product [Caenorhabditis angaria]|uniref:Uncharacterized protein n=1 Tax=Caenorhabditis angaria TaxID=860376 RepID=A0A9P1N0A0_9PELO|nr:unnamed protein product [Caenorhabditis angaria]